MNFRCFTGGFVVSHRNDLNSHDKMKNFVVEFRFNKTIDRRSIMMIRVEQGRKEEENEEEPRDDRMVFIRIKIEKLRK